jgi:hypothetical protein
VRPLPARAGSPEAAGLDGHELGPIHRIPEAASGIQRGERRRLMSSLKIALAGDTMLGRKVAEALTLAGPEALFADEVVALYAGCRLVRA